MPLSKIGRANVKTRKLYKDGLEEEITGPIRVKTTSDGHVIESYRLANGKRRYFATLAGTHWCAHGSSIAEAVADAIFKDPERRPSVESLVAEIQESGKSRKITLSEFRIITGACMIGARDALDRAGRDGSPMTAFEVRDVVSREWGNKLISRLGWGDAES